MAILGTALRSQGVGVLVLNNVFLSLKTSNDQAMPHYRDEMVE
jgi:hypothetical protein